MSDLFRTEDDSASSMVSAGFDDVSREQLDKIKARTMYNMVEPIDGGSKKILFLTNAQATLLGKESASMEKMLDRLEIGKPQLVINLLASPGFGNYCKGFGPKAFDAGSDIANGRLLGWGAGIVSERAPFLTAAAEALAEGKIDTFMSEILLPLAAETNAVVLCNAIPGVCILSASFMRMYNCKRAMWRGKAPFTVLSITNSIHNIYQNKNINSHWRDVSRKSRMWMLREQKINQVMMDTYRDKGGIPTRFFDLDVNAVNLIIVDRINDKKGTFDSKPYTRFLTELVRSLSSKLPSLALKTGLTDKYPLSSKSESSLCQAADSAQSGTPTVIIDIRERPTLTNHTTFENDRGALIKEAIEKFEQYCDQLRESTLVENLDVCTFAYFHDVLTGDGNSLTTETSSRGENLISNDQNNLLPIHLAIAHASSDDDTTSVVETSGVLRRATTTQINQTVDLIVDRYFRDAWELLDDQLKEKGINYTTTYKEQILALKIYGKVLLSSENTYHLNLSDVDGAKKLIHKLVRLDRLPKENPLEGLVLLRTAWCDYDVAMELAGKYKCWCKLLFALHLLLAWFVVGISTSSTSLETFGLSSVVSEHLAVEIVFGVSLALSVIISLDSLMDSKSKWRQLRRGAGALQSVIWSYRSRVGPFSMKDRRRNGTTAGGPEKALMKALNSFHEDLSASANLGTSNFHKKHSASTYKHYQDKGSPTNGEDDYHSPVQPHKYIELRIMANLNFYSQRIPKYNCCKNSFKIMVVLLSVAASALARYKLVTLVVMVTALSSVVTSWLEFTDMANKAERYSQTISGLKNLLNWWASLTSVQKASQEAIGHLINTSEGLITQEQTGWTSGMSNTDSSIMGIGGKEGENNDRKKKNSTTRVVPTETG